MKRTEIVKNIAGKLAGMRQDHTLRCCVDGMACAGKTVFADELDAALKKSGISVIRASIDGFHNPREIRRRQGKESPEGYYRDSFNFEAVIKELLEPLGPGGGGVYKKSVFDYRIEEFTREEPQKSLGGEVLVFDGIFLLRPEIHALWDFAIRLEADCGAVVERAVKRDRAKFGSEDKVKEKYLKRFIPGHKIYEDEVSPSERAHIVIDNTDPAKPVILRQQAAK